MAESNRGGVAVVGVVLLAAAAGGFLYLKQSRERAAPAAVAVPPEAPIATVDTAAEPAHPIEQALGDVAPVEDAVPLPPLAESDAAAIEALLALLGGEVVPSWLVPEFVVQRTVATIDNLTRARVPSNISVVRPVPGALAVEGAGDAWALSAANHARYAPYVEAFERVDTAALVSGYVRHYPLFQQAYRELGNGDAYFNDRLVEVVDHLLAAPEIGPPIQLVRPKVYWEYREPSLEQMSAGHKLMVRMGPAQAARVKAKLREVRAALAGAQVPAG